MVFFSRLWIPLVLTFAAMTLGGCATFKELFTDQGKLVVQARKLADNGNFLGASALAAQALTADPGYQEARILLDSSFTRGQREFQADTARWTSSEAPDRWDRLYDLFRWEDTLVTLGPQLTPALKVPPVKDDLAQAARGAANYHWNRAQDLLNAVQGPRQARKALAEGMLAWGFDPQTPGLDAWLAGARESAAQKLMVVPFTFRGTWISGFGPDRLGSEVSRRLLEEPGLPEATTVFPSERLATVVAAAPDGTGPVFQTDILKIASDAGQNLVLVGTVTKADYSGPSKTSVVLDRQKTITLVDPAHPDGFEKNYAAQVTYTTWTTKASLTVSFTVVEVATGKDLMTAVKEAEVSDQIVAAAYTGDKDALAADDLDALAGTPTLIDPQTLGDRVLTKVAKAVADSVVPALR